MYSAHTGDASTGHHVSLRIKNFMEAAGLRGHLSYQKYGAVVNSKASPTCYTVSEWQDAMHEC